MGEGGGLVVRSEWDGEDLSTTQRKEKRATLTNKEQRERKSRPMKEGNEGHDGRRKGRKRRVSGGQGRGGRRMRVKYKAKVSKELADEEEGRAKVDTGKLNLRVTRKTFFFFIIKPD